MSDIDSDGNFEKFGNDPADDVRPIDLGTPAPVAPPKPRAPASQPVPQPASPSAREDAPEDFPPMHEEEQNLIVRGAYADLLEMEPALRQIRIGAGWDAKGTDIKKIDIDLSCFLLDKNNTTRTDEDFVFYNNEEGCDGAVKHHGDSRTGAGDGDDENVFLDLTSIPFDVMRAMFVLSIYDDEHAGHHFGMVRDMFVRLVNEEDGRELLRFKLDENELVGNAGVLTLCLVREGPRWYAEAIGKPIEAGLGAVAKSYGIIVQEDTG